MSALPADRAPDMLGEAMALADLGFRVIPIKPGGKHPPVPAWQDAATTDPDVIRNWWTHLYRGHGIGIATGNGRVVLDIDVSGDKRGDDTLHELLALHGDLPDTVEAITGSGGRHIWLTAPCEVRNDAGRRLGHGIERCKRWHPGFPDHDEWVGSDWSNAMQSEAGEAGNVVKKLRRVETNRLGKNDPPASELLEMLADEIADTYLYLDLLATFYGIDMAAAIVAKFNAVSEREGWPERLTDETGANE